MGKLFQKYKFAQPEWLPETIALFDESQSKLWITACVAAYEEANDISDMEDICESITDIGVKIVFKLLIKELKQQIRSQEPQVIRNSPDYILWRTEVFRRDRYTCQNCGQVGGVINAHHIKPFARYPELRLDISNGITLCRKCHKLAHRKKA